MSAMNEDYWFPWYPIHYGRDTEALTLAEDGAYRRLIDQYMLRGMPLPCEDRALARLAGCSIEEWREVKSAVLKFFQEENGVLRQKKCDAILKDQEEIAKSRTKGAKTAANARWGNKKTKNARRMRSECGNDADGMRNECAPDAERNAKGMRSDATRQDKKEHNTTTPLPPPTATPKSTDDGGGGKNASQEADRIVEHFLAERDRLWPNHPDMPSPRSTLEVQAKQYLDAQAPADLIAEVVTRVMDENHGKGQSSPPTNLRFCRKSIETAAQNHNSLLNRPTFLGKPNGKNHGEPTGPLIETDRSLWLKSALKAVKAAGIEYTPALRDEIVANAENDDWLRAKIGQENAG